MYHSRDRLTQPLFGDQFDFMRRLDPENRWFKLRDLIPWEDLERLYESRHARTGRPAKDSRLVLGLILLKHLTGLSDIDVVLSVQENPYQQIFCGFEGFQIGRFIDASTLSKQRKRLGATFFRELEAKTLQVLIDRKILRAKGIFVDATVFPEHIKYPNDVTLLNDVRQWLVRQIQSHEQTLGKKVRTYCRKARKVFLGFSKKKVKTKKAIEKAKKSMIQHVRRNLTQLERLLKDVQSKGQVVSGRITDKLETARKIYEQQYIMYKDKRSRITDRVVSFVREKVRPVVRGKAGKEVEFGTKACCVNVDGFVMMDYLSYGAYGEESVVPTHIDAYQKRFGKLPPFMTGDGKYGTRKNRELLQEKGIRSGFKPLGRKAAEGTASTQWYRKKQRERNRIEGSFGTGKNHYGLDRVLYRILDGNEMWIRLGLLGMNLKTADSARI